MASSGMLRACGEQIKLNLASVFNQIAYYEGQFEHFDEEIVNPPTCYIDYQSGEPSEVDDPLGTIDFTLYCITTKLERDPGNMLDLLEETIAALHEKSVRYYDGETPTTYIGKLFYRGFRNNTTFPGLIIWEALFRVER